MTRTASPVESERVTPVVDAVLPVAPRDLERARLLMRTIDQHGLAVRRMIIVAADPEPDAARWQAAADAHSRQITELRRLNAKAVIGTRPIVLDGGQRRNQAFLWSASEAAMAVHDKVYLPNEEYYWEARWYARGELRFDPCHALGLTIGVQICTEVWFFEWARHFARAGVDLLCVPRVTPHASVDKWLAGGRAAAVCAGAYCLSSKLSRTTIWASSF